MSEPCDLCGSESFAPYAPRMYALGGREHDLVRCRACSLVQVRPLPDAASIAALYGDDYFEKHYDSCLSEKGYFDNFSRLSIRYHAVLDAIEAEEPLGALFEVGCAGGYFLKLARERGWRTRGIEITRVGTRHARDELALEVDRRAFPDPELRAGPFDVVYMGHVLEHLRSPAAGLEAARALLRPGGLLVIEVPTYVDSAYFRGLRRALPYLHALGLAAPDLLRALKFPVSGEIMEPFHLYEFRRHTLVTMLERGGYRIRRTVSRVPKPDDLARARDALRRIVSRGFDVLDLGARTLGLPGGNLAVFARRAR